MLRDNEHLTAYQAIPLNKNFFFTLVVSLFVFTLLLTHKSIS